MSGEEAKHGAAVEFDGEAKCREETRAENRSNRKMTRLINRPRWRSRHPSHHTRWEPVSAKGPSKLGVDGSMKDRGREGTPTPILETSANTEQHEPEGMVGGGERPRIEVEADAETGIACGTT